MSYLFNILMLAFGFTLNGAGYVQGSVSVASWPRTSLKVLIIFLSL